MQGQTIKKLYEDLSSAREVDFEYRGREYTIHTGEDNGRYYLYIYDYTDIDPIFMCRHPIPGEELVPYECIEAVLECKCFDGQSFMDIESGVRITEVA